MACGESSVHVTDDVSFPFISKFLWCSYDDQWLSNLFLNEFTEGAVNSNDRETTNRWLFDAFVFSCMTKLDDWFDGVWSVLAWPTNGHNLPMSCNNIFYTMACRIER